MVDVMPYFTLQKAKSELGVDSWTVGPRAHGGYWVWGYEKDRPGQAQDDDEDGSEEAAGQD